MSAHGIYKWLTGGLLSVSFVALPACQTTPAQKPEALTGQIEQPVAKKVHKWRYIQHGKGAEWSSRVPVYEEQ